MDAENLYLKLRETAADAGGFINDYSDELLANAARSIAEDPNSEEND